MPEVTLDLRDSELDPSKVTVEITLWGAGTRVVGALADGALIVEPIVVTADGHGGASEEEGVIVVDLPPNADITPEGTVWRVRVGRHAPLYYVTDESGWALTDEPGSIESPALTLHILDPDAHAAAIAAAVDVEEARALAAEAGLSEDIADEAAARAAADTAHAGAVVHVPTSVGQPAGRIPTTDGAGGWSLDDPNLTFATDLALQGEIDRATTAEAGLEATKVPFKHYALSPPVARSVTVTAEASNPRPLEYWGGYLWGVVGAQIHRSADRGVTWSLVATSPSGAGISAIRPCTDGEVLILRQAGIWRTSGWAANPATATDSLVTTPSNHPLSYFLPWGFDGDGTKWIVVEYAGTGNWASSRLGKISTNQGVTWSTVWDSDVRFPGDGPNSHLHAACYDAWADRFFLSEGHGVGRGVYWSDDNGGTWTRVGGSFDPDASPTVLVATDSGIVCGSDADHNGVYGIARTPTGATLEIRLLWRWRAGETGIVGFAKRGWRDPDTGLVYVAFRSSLATVAPIIAAGDARTAGVVYTASPGANDEIHSAVVADGRLAAWITQGGAEKHIYGLVDEPGVAPDQEVGRANIGGGTAVNTAVSVGPRSNASGVRSVALGVVSTASAVQSNAVGHTATASGDRAIAIGATTTASAADAIAIGDAVTASSANAIGIGTGAAPGGTAAIAVGSFAAAVANCVAIGPSSAANGLRSVAYGQLAVGAGTDSVVVGFNARANPTSTSFVVAVGSGAVCGGAAGVAVGYQASASGANSAALGFQSSAGHARSVALGQLSVTSAADQIHVGQRHMEYIELASDPAAPSADRARAFVRDNGAGKTQFCVRFATGAVQVVSTEP